MKNENENKIIFSINRIMLSIFIKHPKEVCRSYFEHFQNYFLKEV